METGLRGWRQAGTVGTGQTESVRESRTRPRAPLRRESAEKAAGWLRAQAWRAASGRAFSCWLRWGSSQHTQEHTWVL